MDRIIACWRGGKPETILSVNLRGKKLEYTMRLPFSEFAEASKTENWPALVDGFRTCPARRLLILQMSVTKKHKCIENIDERISTHLNLKR